MMSWIHAVTGGSDFWRCLQRAGCKASEYLRLSYHLQGVDDRTTEVVAEQWHLAIWTFAFWCATHYRGPIQFHDGEAFVPCPGCDTLLPLQEGDALMSGKLSCRSGGCQEEGAVAYVLHSISKTPFTRAVNTARSVCGGVRGYPLLRGMPCRLQLPVLHCTGTMAKVLTHFVLACLPGPVQDSARMTMLAISGKGKTDALYLREFRELVAHAAARPQIFSADLDAVFVILFQLLQLLNAAWRSSLGNANAAGQDAAASIVRLAASIFGPLFQEVKPLDPQTKDAKVLSLYLHAPIAHLHHQVGSNRPQVAYVSDDNMEGHVRGVGRYIYNHGNNASQAALLSDVASLCEATIKFSTPRSHPSSLVFTKYVHVCACWKTLGERGPNDYEALATMAEADPHLTVERRAEGDELLFTLPLHEQVDANKATRLDASDNVLTGKKESLRRGLRRSQAVIKACVCGKLTGGPASSVMGVVRGRQTAARTRAATMEDSDGAAPEPVDGATTDGSGNDMAEEGGGAPAAPAPRPTRLSDAEAVRHSVPPLWLLQKCFLMPAAYAAVLEVAPAGPEPPPALVDASLRMHISALRVFLMRARTTEFKRWAAGATVDSAEMVEAAETMVERLSSTRLAHLSVLVGDDDAMEL